MNFVSVDRAIFEPHYRDAFPFPPPTCAVPAAQSGTLSDRSPHGDCLDVREDTDDLKVHLATLARGPRLASV